MSSTRRPDLLPGASVIIPTFQGAAHIRRCITSLSLQTLDPGLFEIVIIVNGPPDGTTAVLDRFRTDHPELTTRVIRLARPGVARARNAGIAAAKRQYITFVDDDDYVSPAFLEVLLMNAGPRLMSISGIVDVGPDGYDAGGVVSWGLSRRVGVPVPAGELVAAASFNAAKMVATELLKDLRYDTVVASGEDVLFWCSALVKRHLNLISCGPDSGAVYYRVVRPDSISRRELTFDFAVRQRLDVIGRLEGLLDEAHEGVTGLVETRINSQASFINAYLRHNPAEHGRVLDAIHAAGISHPPFQHINKNLAQDLNISYAFVPYADTSAVVMSKRIQAEGRIVDVISNSLDAIRGRDETLQRIAGPYVSQHKVMDHRARFSDWSSMQTFTLKGLKVIDRWERKKGRYRRVYSRAHFAASHFLAAIYKISNPAAIWRAEFSDPLSRNVHGEERGTDVDDGEVIDVLSRELRRRGLPVPQSRNCFVWCEEVTYALADELIFTNEHQLEYMLRYCTNPDLIPIVRDKATITPHPTLPSAYYEAAKSDYSVDDEKINLAYFGNFYATRGLDDVLTAIAQCDQSVRERIVLHVFTTTADKIQNRAEELGIARYIRTNPYVDYLEFLELTRRFSSLIVNDAVTADHHMVNPYLPSKWSDYRGSGTPVWGLVEPGSPLSKESLDYVSIAGDIASAIRVLREIATL